MACDLLLIFVGVAQLLVGFALGLLYRHLRDARPCTCPSDAEIDAAIEAATTNLTTRGGTRP